MQENFENPIEAYYEIFTDNPLTEGYKYNFISPTDFRNFLIKTAKKNNKNTELMDTSIENPNFFCPLPRYSFALLTKICVKIGENLKLDNVLGFIPEKEGIEKKFTKILNKYSNLKEGKFLKEACNRMRIISGMEKNSFIHNIVTSTIGCLYPNPVRVQNFVEPVMIEYLQNHVYKSKKSFKNKIKVMPTEGSSSSLILVLNSLKHNKILKKEDKIGIITPICSSYLEISSLENYNFQNIYIQADQLNNGYISQTEIEKIGNPKMKVLLLINPSNPTGTSLSSGVIRKISKIVRVNNPNLIIIEDNLYSPFIEKFYTFFNSLSKNTIGIFSFSKYFGATGCNLGLIALHNNNVIDNILLNSYYNSETEDLNKRYLRTVNNKKGNIKFIDKIFADYRQIIKSNLGGLSTPQQTMMCLFSMHEILKNKNAYNNNLKNTLINRKKKLLKSIDCEIIEKNTTNVYVVIDIPKIADILMGGTNFGDYIRKNEDPFDFIINLAKRYNTIVLPTVAFAGMFWGIRICLANLNESSYEKIGKNILFLIDDYYKKFKKWETKQIKIDMKEDKTD